MCSGGVCMGACREQGIPPKAKCLEGESRAEGWGGHPQLTVPCKTLCQG